MSCGGDFFKALHISRPELVEVSASKIRTYSLTMYLKNYATIGLFKKKAFLHFWMPAEATLRAKTNV